MTQVSQAPAIEGLTYISDLGHGGFADVYLYKSHFPEREVAVKVLRDRQMSEKLSQRFADEANIMAALEHPYIVRVYRYGKTSDGRPYIEMAYYPQESLAKAVKAAPFSVIDVLRTGVELASAVETAHRAGLLHRDIKPANVLRDKFGDPALTDFGIASRLHESDDEDASLSVPWAPVETMFSTAAVDQRSDVYSLAATLWHLLVGRSPFEIPGGDNRPAMMMVRARDLPVPSTGRGDVPPSLDRLLQQAMSKEKRLRPASAADFARALQSIEQELHLRPTSFKIPQEYSTGQQVKQVALEGTRLRGGPVVVDTGLPPAKPDSNDAATRLRARNTIEPEHPVLEESPEKEKKPVPKAGLISALVIVLVAALVFGVYIIVSGLDGWGGAIAESSSPSEDSPIMWDPPPGEVTVEATRAADGVTFTWTYSNKLDSDFYDLQKSDGTSDSSEDSSYTWEGAPPDACLQVRVVRYDGSHATEEYSEKGCAP